MEDRPGDDRPQLPPPSLWPVGFAVGIVCLLVGLVVSWPAAAVGAGLALVFGFLWAREVATGRAQVEGPPPAEPSPDAPAVPAHVGEAAMPKPEPGERFPRSRFLEGATLGLGGLIGVIVTLPAAGFAILPGFLKQKAHKVDLGPITDFEENKWKVVTFIRDPSQGEISRRTAFVRNNGLLDGVPSFTIISNRCAHVGCPVQPGGPVFQKQEKTTKTRNGAVLITPVLPAAGFICPCHGGSYDQEGNRIAGPPVRGLDRYEFDIVDGRLVLGNLYSVGKVEGSGKTARIKRYELTGPGQHVDGPEAWFYPLQPPH
ncbi:MAG TPA: Rieske 2Fe-2S domain-containing protein [Gaiellaceae bacterium]|nr:Rieske 2Fe-2S domain-containing protein [Gaiellaceae bacterium]